MFPKMRKKKYKLVYYWSEYECYFFDDKPIFLHLELWKFQNFSPVILNNFQSLSPHASRSSVLKC